MRPARGAAGEGSARGAKGRGAANFTNMKLSEARILYLARESLNRLREEGLAEIPNFPLALRQGREIVAGWVDKGDEVDAVVRRKINSIKRGIVEGSPEWEILYRRYRDEELRKKGPAR
ncbi:MAG TPA: DUF507 family protein [Candidatus Binataceae bacterium]